MSKEFKVVFQPSGRSVFVLPGTVLIEAAARAGHVIETPCGGMGTCGKCLVRVAAGECGPCESGESRLTEEQLAAGYRLACQCRVHGDLTVEIPDSSLFQSGAKILASSVGGDTEIEQAVHKRFIELTPPGSEDQRSDRDRLEDAMPGFDVVIEALRHLPDALRAGSFGVTVTTVDHRIVRVEPGNSTDRLFGMAFDIGTTTLVGTLVDLRDGRDLAVASMVNPQTSFGDDVVSRIKACRDAADGLRKLHEAIVDAANRLIGEAARKASVLPDELCRLVFAGNTTMQEILCGVSPVALGELPFVPAFREAPRLKAGDLKLRVCSSADVVVFPQIGGFVGGDTVAGIVATELDRRTKPALLVDVGTNGEIVLVHEGRLTATSVAAGPAFEGARIVHGMRATNGAIEKVVLDGDVQINVIGDVPPSGLCGTGLIDAVAELLRAGVLDSTGRILPPEELPGATPDAIRRRVIEQGGQHHFVLAREDESATGAPVLLCQRDIRELQLANGAIRAGIALLLKTAGLDPADLNEVLLAGAFGNFIRRSNAQRIGMLPPISHERIRFVGNTASFGAKRVLLSGSQMEYACRVARVTRHLDLSLDPEFQSEFGAAMLFPESEVAG